MLLLPHSAKQQRNILFAFFGICHKTSYSKKRRDATGVVQERARGLGGSKRIGEGQINCFFAGNWRKEHSNKIVKSKKSFKARKKSVHSEHCETIGIAKISPKKAKISQF
jgi:hypothetical protein